MNIEISRALGTLQGMTNEFFAMLPPAFSTTGKI
jgi:hypothetical protein